MNAVLLAAGLGTRLRPLTDHTPKCLVEIAGRTLLDYWLTNLHEAGIRNFLINTHHLAEQVRQFVEHHSLRDRITLVHESHLLGTAGTLVANREFLLEGATLVAHADNLCLCSWSDFLSAHARRPAQTLMTMMTFETATPEDCGIVELDAKGIVQAFHEKVPTPPGNLANAAVYLVEPGLIQHITDRERPAQDFSTEVIPALLGRIYTWENHGLLVDIGSPDRLDHARKLVSSWLPPSMV